MNALFLVCCGQCSAQQGHACLRHAAYCTNEVSLLTDLNWIELQKSKHSVMVARDELQADLKQHLRDRESSGSEFELKQHALKREGSWKNKVVAVSKTAWPPYIQDASSPEHRNAVARATRYHQIFHHQADKMEKNIAMGNGYGCKPGDSRYLPDCPICMSTGIDRVRRSHTNSNPVASTRSDDTLPGQKWLMDGNDTTIYSQWGNYRSVLCFVDSVSYYRVCVPVRTAQSRELIAAVRYVQKFTKMCTGRDMTGLYTDMAASTMSKETTDYLADMGIKLEVVPPDLHHLNGIAEEAVHSQTRGMRVRLPSLKGFAIKNSPIDVHRFWPLANEHAVQCHNNTSYPPLERKHGHPLSPRQCFFADPTLKSHEMRPFGEICYVVIAKEKRTSKLHDTAECCRYLFNAGFNPITNVLADCPRAHVVLRPNGTVSCTAKVVFPKETMRQPDSSEVTPMPDVTERASLEAEQIKVNKLLAQSGNQSAQRALTEQEKKFGRHYVAKSKRDTSERVPLSDSPYGGACDHGGAPEGTATLPNPISDRVRRGPAEPPPAESVSPEPPPVPQRTASPGDSIDIDPGQAMPRASFFADKDIRIRWVPSKAKRPGTTSGEEYKVYSQASTTRELYSYDHGRLGAKHFTNDMTKGIFEFIDEPYRALQQAEISKLRAEVRREVLRLLAQGGDDHLETPHFEPPDRAHDGSDSLLHTAPRPYGDASCTDGGDAPSHQVTHDTTHSTTHTRFYRLLDKLPTTKLTALDDVIQTLDAEMLHLTTPAYDAVRNAYFQDTLHYEDDTHRLEALHPGCYTTMYDTNESLEDQLLLSLSDTNVTEFVIQLTAEPDDDRPLNHTPPRRRDQPGDTTAPYTVKPEDVVIDELHIPGLKDYKGEERTQMAKAVAKEMQDLASLGTFAWCKQEDGRKPISSKLVLKIKYKADGELDKFKGRLVAEALRRDQEWTSSVRSHPWRH